MMTQALIPFAAHSSITDDTESRGTAMMETINGLVDFLHGWIGPNRFDVGRLGIDGVDAASKSAGRYAHRAIDSRSCVDHVDADDGDGLRLKKRSE